MENPKVDGGGIMFRLVFSGVTVYFVDPTKDYAEASRVISDDFRNIMFIDIPQNNNLSELLKLLKRPGRKLILRNKDWEPEWADPNSEFHKLFTACRSEIAKTNVRSCTDVAYYGESCEEDKTIVSNITLDGFFAALKAVGLYYQCIDLDSRILCGKSEGFISVLSANLAKQFYESKHDQAQIAKLFDDFAAPLIVRDYSAFSEYCVFEPIREASE